MPRWTVQKVGSRFEGTNADWNIARATVKDGESGATVRSEVRQVVGGIPPKHGELRTLVQQRLSELGDADLPNPLLWLDRDGKPYAGPEQ